MRKGPRRARGLRAAGIAAVVAVVALPEGVRADPTEPLSLQYPLVDPSDCSNCHQFPNPPEHQGDPDVAPFSWQGSMMANAARDPVFWAGVAIAHQDEPGATVDCVRCHAPVAFLGGSGDAIAVEELDAAEREGIVCELCHRMIDDGVTPAGNGRYVVDDEAQDGVVPRRGPWAYEPDTGPPHPWSDDNAFIASSQMCGTCHDVTTHRERVDASGTGLGMPFNEQRTYSEWLASDYAAGGADGRTCQDCHMPAVADVAGCDTLSLQGDLHATGGRRHDLAGANRRMIEILRAEYGSAGSGEIADFHYDRALDRVDETLAAAAELEVEMPAEVDLAAGIVSLPVTVTNLTGHKLPTGYSEGRVMWLEVTATYGDDVVYSSGAWSADDGIEDDPQVRRYEAIAEDSRDGTRLHLLRNDRWVVDDRIPPKGLRPDIETDPVGDRYQLTADGVWPHFDAVEYAFGAAEIVDATPGEPDELTIRVRLLYVINTPEYLRFLAETNVTNGAGEHAADLFELYDVGAPLVLAEEVAVVPLRGLVPPADTGTTGAPGTGDGGTTGSGAGSGTRTTDGGSSGAGADAESGCACGVGGQRAPVGWALILAMSWRRRRRLRASPPPTPPAHA